MGNFSAGGYDMGNFSAGNRYSPPSYEHIKNFTKLSSSEARSLTPSQSS